ncbi:MAG: glycosyl transferase family 2 [Clostridia bacterium]|nr:glycosyl transferase family 2 [Clostridia bacterium]
MILRDKLDKCLASKPDNHILPFFWQHGEDDETILEELRRIADSGVGALCVESRPHEGFARDPWWDDMKLILNESAKLGLDVWVLDDKYFPTGFCNGAVKERFPELGKRGITEKHIDVRGPVKDGCVILDGWADEGDSFVAAVACKRGDKAEELTGECLDITENVHDGLIFFDVPEGVWRVFLLFERPVKDGRVDFTNPQSVDLMFSEIYEPHFKKLGKYFGNTFKGFFSDEPFLMDKGSLPKYGETKSHGVYPWNEYIKNEVITRYGKDWLLHLPSLWFTMEGVTPKYRVAYMDGVTTLYKTNFCDRVGDWCREHGVEYIGHIVEDYDQHSNMGSGGHYFRSLDGQDMAGVDVVLCQIVPGMTEHANACPCWYDTADPDFFHFSLAKLASSHSDIQPLKKGRAMCEIFGAYGWAEGLKMMKWLADHMLVRGMNYFVPHAFSAKFPDEVPPQFTGAGHNAEFRYFKILMEYMNRVSTMLDTGRHICSAAILYHAEAEWTGGDYMKFYEPARRLTENNIDFDIVPVDYLLNATANDGKMVISGNFFDCFIVPYSEYLPEKALFKLKELSENGVDVVFVDSVTDKTAEGKGIELHGEHVFCCELSSLSEWMSNRRYYDVKTDKQEKYLRFYHRRAGEEDVYMLTNEGIDATIRTGITFGAFKGGKYVRYFPLENKAYSETSCDGHITVTLKPYESVIFVFGSDVCGLDAIEEYETGKTVNISGKWNLSFCTAEEYPSFREVREIDELENVTSPKNYPRFGGFMKYEKRFKLSVVPGTGYSIDLGYVGETAEVTVNGKYCGTSIVPPYVFDVTDSVKEGENELCVVVSNHLGYEQRDLCSKYLLMEPSGLLGPVILSERKSKK